MKKVHLIVPALAFAAFSVYYVRWNRGQEALRALQERDPIGFHYIGRSGSKEAATDLAAGRPRYLIYGEPNWEYEKIMRGQLQKLRITVDRVAGCEVTQPVVSYVASYNSEIVKAFGSDAIRAAFESAYDQTQRAAKPSAPSGSG